MKSDCGTQAGKSLIGVMRTLGFLGQMGKLVPWKKAQKKCSVGEKPDFSYNEEVDRAMGTPAKETGQYGNRRTKVSQNSVEGMGRGVIKWQWEQVNRKAEKGEERESALTGTEKSKLVCRLTALPPFFPHSGSQGHVNWTNQSYFCIFKWWCRST